MLMKVIGGSLNVRNAPDLSAGINHILAEGEVIEVGEKEGDWYKYGSGYVMAKWLEEAPEETAPGPVVEEAEEKPKKKTTRKKTTAK